MSAIAQLPLVIGVMLVVLGTWASAALVYGLARLALGRRISEQSPEDRSKTDLFAQNLLRVTGTLLALILSFNLNGLRNDYTALRDSIQLEGAQLLDIATDLDSFSTPEAQSLREDLERYVLTVVEDEWASLAAGQGLHTEASETFDDIQLGIHELDAFSETQESLRENLIIDIDEISDYRTHRAFQALPNPPQLLLVAVIGFLFSVATFVIYEPSSIRIFLAGVYCTFVGLVIYSVLTLNAPFTGIIAISPEPLNTVYREISQM